MDTYYKPSGKFSPASFVYFLILCVTAFPILGLLYAYCIWYIPFIYINFIIAGIFGLITGFLINSFVIGKGKVRNVTLAVLLGILGGAIALYFHWAVWVDLVINAGESYGSSRIGVTVSNIKIFQVFGLVARPDILFEFIGQINEFGTWGIKGSTVSGIFLTIIWIIEFIIIVGVSTFMTFPKAYQPFCEQGNTWFEEKELGTFQFIENTAEIKKQLESKDSSQIEGVKMFSNTDTNHSIFTLYTSKFGENYLTIDNKTAKIDKNGKLDFDSDEFVEYIAITSSLRDVLINKKNEPEFTPQQESAE